MPWWNRSGGGGHSQSARSQSAQSPSSQSSSPKCLSSSSSPPRQQRQRRDFGIVWSRRDMHHQQPRLTRQRKLRHLTNLDVEGLEGVGGGGGQGRWGALTPVTRSASTLESSPAIRFAGTARSALRPQPLPLPEKVGYQLPSPQETLGRGVGEEASGTSESSSSLLEPIGERLSSANPVR